MQKKIVIILRGCPGAGKTAYLKLKYPEAFHCSATLYFTDCNGNYKFYPKGLNEAHKYCRNAFKAALQNGQPVIAVDNTNVRIWEFENYIETAEDYGYEVKVLRIEADPDVAADRNIHGVPKEKALLMHNKMEDYASEEIIYHFRIET